MRAPKLRCTKRCSSRFGIHAIAATTVDSFVILTHYSPTGICNNHKNERLSPGR